MKDKKKQGASLSPERHLIQKMVGIQLKEERRRKSKLNKAKRRLKRIINAPHNTNTFLIAAFQDNQRYAIEEMDENSISPGTMIGFDLFNIGDGDVVVEATPIISNNEDNIFASLLL